MYEYVSVFIRDHLLSTHTDYTARIYRDYKKVYGEALHVPHKKKLPSYNSFAKRVSRLMRAGLIERTGVTEPSSVLTAMNRVYLRLTPEGRRATAPEWVTADRGG